MNRYPADVGVWLSALQDTRRRTLRILETVEPQWIEAAGDHLIKRSYSEPHWVEERGFVAAFESVSPPALITSKMVWFEAGLRRKNA